MTTTLATTTWPQSKIKLNFLLRLFCALCVLLLTLLLLLLSFPLLLVAHPSAPCTVIILQLALRLLLSSSLLLARKLT